MTITVYSDVLFPDEAAVRGVRGRTIRRNERAQAQGGHQQVNVLWSRSLREYEVGIIPLAASAWGQIEALHEITDGGAFGMLLRDPKDAAATAAQGLMQPAVDGEAVGAIGVGYGVPVLQLFKRYAASGTTRTHDRRITRPESPAALLRGGLPVNIGIAAGHAAIDYATGTVTFVADTSQSIASVTVGAATVVNFNDGLGIVAALAIGQRVYLSGITGTAAAVLNGLSHEVTAKGATSLTIATSTTGLAASSGTGNAAKYPQASEALAWSGGFFVPVHFRDDYIDWELVRGGAMEDVRLIAGPAVVLEEVRE